MEARQYNENLEQVRPITPQERQDTSALVQEYRDITPSAKKIRKRQRKELSFFAHIGSYSILLALCLSLSMTISPFIIAVPVGLLLPIGVILGMKTIFRQIFKQQAKQKNKR